MSGLRLEQVTAGYGQTPVLRNFCFAVQKGERVAVMGPSGCGKTTLLRLLLGTLPPQAGRVEGAGRCGVVFQEDRLCEQLSARQNVALVCPRAQQPALPSLLDALGLNAEQQARSVSQLSGGQRRRVALARALAYPSDFLLLDEPFKGLDAAALRSAIDVVKQNLAGRGLVLVTHDAAEAAALAARVVQLDGAG